MTNGYLENHLDLMKANVLEAHRHARRAQGLVETLILALPTGAARNAVTDANIHILSALAVLANLPDTLDLADTNRP